MREFQRSQHNKQFGFTLMEIIVATAIFVTVVTAVLALFNYVLQVNRRVQAVRQVAQGTRAFTEILSREIRNGRIGYPDVEQTPSGECLATRYASAENQTLTIIRADGTSTCMVLTTEQGTNRGLLVLERRNLAGNFSDEIINPPNFSINPSTFRIIVRPTTNPFGPSNKGIQPMVTILAEFIVFPGQADEQVIPYQTTISSDVHNIPPL